MKVQSILSVLDRLILSKKVWIFFFLSSLMVFSPFFFHGDFIVSTTDSIFGHYPNLLFGYDQMKEGHLPLWNSYLLGGIDFTKSMHNHFLDPTRWILLLFPKEWIFHVITAIEFVEVSFVGLLAFLIAREVFRDRGTSFISALVVQLSGFTWFVTSTFIGVELFFLTLLLVYLQVTFHRRRNVTNYLWMTLVIAAALWKGHVGYIAAFAIPILVFQVVRHRQDYKVHGIFLLAGISAFALALYRLYPILTASEVFGTFRFAAIPSIFYSSNGYHLLTGFLPAFFGATLPGCVERFQPMLIEGHNQFHNLLYYGMSTIFFLLLAISGRFQAKMTAQGWFTVYVILGSLFIFQPATDLIYLGLLSLCHGILYRVGISFLIFTLFAKAIHRLNEKRFQFEGKDFRGLLVLVLLVLTACATFYTHFFMRSGIISLPEWFFLLEWSVIITLFSLAFWFGLKFSLELRGFQRLTTWLGVGVLGAFFVAWVWYLFRENNSMVKTLFYDHLGVILWSLCVILLCRVKHISKILLGALGSALLFSLYVLFFRSPWCTTGTNQLDEGLITFYSIGTFLVVAFSTLELFAHFFHKTFKKEAFILLLTLLLIGDLSFYLKVYSYSGGPPFWKTGTLYPDMSLNGESQVGQEMKHFRVNFPGNYMKYPYHQAFSNAFMTYGFRTVGGVDSVISLDLIGYFQNFMLLGPEHLNRGMIFPGISHPRLESLFGIKYSYTSEGVQTINEEALARFSQFSSFEVTENSQEAIEKLQEDSFKINTVALLSKPDYSNTHLKNQDHPFQPLDYVSRGDQSFEIKVNGREGPVVLFNETFDSAWRAKWNGQPLDVVKANGYFMGVVLPEEEGTLTFTFYPRNFLFLAKGALLLFGGLLCLGVYLFLTRKNQHQEELMC